MSGIVESHGGTVEKSIGDAVMAVFGVPASHEDDALRACRAAVEMRNALPELGIRGRVGVNTGEVVTGTSERLATGDAVNFAARFEQAAAPGEVLIGETTHTLVREAVMVEAVEPLALKGKSKCTAIDSSHGRQSSPLRVLGPHPRRCRWPVENNTPHPLGYVPRSHRAKFDSVAPLGAPTESRNFIRSSSLA